MLGVSTYKIHRFVCISCAMLFVHVQGGKGLSPDGSTLPGDVAHGLPMRSRAPYEERPLLRYNH